MRYVARSLAAMGVVGVLSSLTVIPFVWFESKQKQQSVAVLNEEIQPPAPVAGRPFMPLRSRPPGSSRGELFPSTFGRTLRAPENRPSLPAGLRPSPPFSQPPPLASELEAPWIGGVVNMIPAQPESSRPLFAPEGFHEPLIPSDY